METEIPEFDFDTWWKYALSYAKRKNLEFHYSRISPGGNEETINPQDVLKRRHDEVINLQGDEKRKRILYYTSSVFRNSIGKYYMLEPFHEAVKISKNNKTIYKFHMNGRKEPFMGIDKVVFKNNKLHKIKYTDILYTPNPLNINDLCYDTLPVKIQNRKEAIWWHRGVEIPVLKWFDIMQQIQSREMFKKFFDKTIWYCFNDISDEELVILKLRYS